MSIKLLVGLGNPGDKYRYNRHNVGFWFVDMVADYFNKDWQVDNKFIAHTCKINIDDDNVILIKPQNYMNNSGKSIANITNFFKIKPEQILVIHDDLDLTINTIKIKKNGGHGGHNGLRDIISFIGKDFYRLRIGIGRPIIENDVVNFVLQNPNKDDKKIITNKMLLALNIIPKFINNQTDKIMQQLHIKVS